MRLTANSAITCAGKKYLPGQALPDDTPEEVRLEWLRVGYAVKAKEQGTPARPPSEIVPAEESQGPPAVDPLPAPDVSMSLAALKELAHRYGVDADKERSKAKVIELITATGRAPA